MHTARWHQGNLPHRMACRLQAETLVHHTGYLSEQDALLLEMVLDRGSSFLQIARFFAVSEPTVRRRFKRMLERLLRPESQTVLGRSGLKTHQITVAQAYFLEGLSKSDIVRRTGLTGYFVRKTLTQIRLLSRQHAIQVHASGDRSASVCA